MNRRQALVSLGVLGLAGVAYSHIEDRNMKRLKPRDYRIPADLHAHIYKNTLLNDVGETLSQEGLVGLTTYNVKNNLFNFYDLRLIPGFTETELGVLGKLNYLGSTGYILNSQEIMTKPHISALGCKDLIRAKNPFEAVKEIRKQGGLAILNHPYVVPSRKMFPPWEAGYRLINKEERQTIEKLAGEVDEVEVFNGQCIALVPLLIDKREANDLAEEYAQTFGFKGIATSDAHWINQILTSGIYIKNEELSFKKIKEAIMGRDYYIEGNEVSRLSFLKGHFPSLPIPTH